MTLLTKYIADVTPKFDKHLTEGLVYHRLNYAADYISDFMRFFLENKPDSNMVYEGFRELKPQEEVDMFLKVKSKPEFDLAENDISLVAFKYRYGNEPKSRETLFYVPHASKGNIIRMSGNRFLVMPVLADKVVSVSERLIFINILTAKYNFSRFLHSVLVNDQVQLVSIVEAPLYKNQSNNPDFPDTTKAKTTIMHYLLANYGLYETLRRNGCDFVKPVYDCDDPDMVIVSSTGQVPRGYIRTDSVYEPTRIKFAVPKDKFNADVQYVLGNIFYVIDHFPDKIDLLDIDNPKVWRRLMGEIIHSGTRTITYLNEKMLAHFNDLNTYFDPITVSKLKDVGIKADTLMILMGVIFQNFNEWTLSDSPRSIYDTKSYNVETFVLSAITTRITRFILDINKEELRKPDGLLTEKEVDAIAKRHLGMRCIFGLRKARNHVTSIDSSTDHLYFKNTAMVVQQESDPIDPNNPDSNTADRTNLVATMATAGSILGLSKKNPTPLIRANPYLKVDPVTGALILPEELKELVIETDKLLANSEENDFIFNNLEQNNDDEDNEDDFDDFEEDFDFDDEDGMDENWD